jgi:hypothetical protein
MMEGSFGMGGRRDIGSMGIPPSNINRSARVAVAVRNFSYFKVELLQSLFWRSLDAVWDLHIS